MAASIPDHRAHALFWPQLVGQRLAAHAFLRKIGPAETQKLRDRVALELKTTFASHYTQVVSYRAL